MCVKEGIMHVYLIYLLVVLFILATSGLFSYEKNLAELKMFEISPHLLSPSPPPSRARNDDENRWWCPRT